MSDRCRAGNEKTFYFGARDGGGIGWSGDWAGREPFGIAARDKSAETRRALRVISVLRIGQVVRAIRVIGRRQSENF
jgi:hypothetical protein